MTTPMTRFLAVRFMLVMVDNIFGIRKIMRVLVVEDNLDIQANIADFLKKQPAMSKD